LLISLYVQDGLVKLASANLQQLSQDIVEDVKQVIKMGADDTPISFDKFVKFMVAVQEKTHKGTQLLVLKHKTHTDDNDSTHHIKMDRLSRNLSMSRRKFSTKQEWYKLICMDREKGLQKVDSLRKEKEALEMAECTFRPELYGRGNKSSKGRSLKGSHSEEIQSPNSIVERETQEVHGFYFKDEHGPGNSKFALNFCVNHFVSRLDYRLVMLLKFSTTSCSLTTQALL